MELVANKAGIGDFYIISDNRKNYIIDGGNRKVDLRVVPSHIEVIICTHNDKDHTYGIIDILKRSSSSIREVWLPGFWQPIIDFIVEENFDLLELYEISEQQNSDNRKINLKQMIIETDLEINDNYSQNLLNSLRAIKANYFWQNNCCIISPSIFRFRNKLFSNQLFNLSNILEIAHLALEKGAKIRWFFPEDKETNNSYEPFNAKNSKEIVRLKKIRDKYSFFKLLYLTPENKYSLVFEYIKNEKPLILFTADSDLRFINNPGLTYDESIVVTAPHHGSEENSQAYGKINGQAIIFLRSGGSQNSLPGKTFLKLKNDKYCNKCLFKNSPEQQLKFTYNVSWNYVKGYYCKC